MITKQESTTAKLCAFARAYHSNFSKEKIFDDYLAFDLMGFDGYNEIAGVIADIPTGESGNAVKPKTYGGFSKEKFSGNLADYIAPIPLIRIDFTERIINRFTRRHKGRIQYVILGAGMDTFSFRNANDSISVFEVDHPDTQRFKLDRIRELSWRIPQGVRFVPVDFARDRLAERLYDQDFADGVPTVFSILGVSYYLSLPTFTETLKTLSSIAHDGDLVVFDFPDETTLAQNASERTRTLARITQSFGEPMVHGFRLSEIRQALNSAGFEVVNHLSPKAIEHHYFRGRSDGLHAFDNIHLISAVRREVR